MRFISTRIHGRMDYAMGGLLLASPWLFGFARGGSETRVPLAVGLATLGVTMLTDFEDGLAPVVPVRAHLVIDAAQGALLAASPWLFGFHRSTWEPHVVFGLLDIAAALFTKTAREDEAHFGLGSA